MKPTSSQSDLTLLVEQPGGFTQQVFIQNNLTLGRGDSNIVCIDDPSVDHIHARVLRQADGKFVLQAESQGKINITGPDGGLNEVDKVILEPGLAFKIGTATLTCRKQKTHASAILADSLWEAACPRCQSVISDQAEAEHVCSSCSLPLFRHESKQFTGWLPRKVGPYEIRKFVAKGGMGVVLRGVHKESDQLAAIKLPHPELVKDERWARRFEGEIKTLERLVHPNLVRLQASGREESLMWLAMDWVEGESLSGKIGRGLGVEEVRSLMEQAVKGLGVLHGKGIMHRDLKPSNLLVGADGALKLADFGLAKAVGGEESMLTATGTLAGTGPYMAPEQWQGLELSEATDVYALGIIWHELLTGKRPQLGEVATEGISLPSGWESMLEKCLRNKPSERPVLQELEECLSGKKRVGGVGSQKETRTKGRGLMPWAVVLVLGAVVGLGYWMSKGPVDETKSAGSTEVAEESKPDTAKAEEPTEQRPTEVVERSEPEAPVQTTVVTEPEAKPEVQEPIEEEKPIRVVSSSEELSNKVLNITVGTEPEDIDPHVVTGVPEHHIIVALTEGLVAEDPVDLHPVPGTAETWEVSEDGTMYTFHLRENAKWTNGDPVTADDFVQSFKRILTPALASKYSYMLFVMKGAEDYSLGKLKDFSQVGARAIDERTLEITLNAPTPYFLSLLNHYTWFPVHIATVAKHDGLTRRGSGWSKPENFVGNGAFKLKSWRLGRKIVVEKNHDYWDAETTKLNEIHFYPIELETTQENAFRGGQLHNIYSLHIDKIATYKKKHADELQITPYLASYFYRFNVNRKPCDDVRVRKALAMAINREALVKNVTKGEQMPALFFTPPGVAGYTARARIEENVEKAKQLLAEAGYPDGEGFPSLELLYNTTEGHRIIAEAIQQMWKKNLNINITLKNQEWKVYLDRQREMDYQISRAGWTGDYPDPNTFLDMWTSWSQQNQTGWANPKYDALIRKATVTKDPAARLDVFQQAEEILMDEVPILPIYIYTRVYALNPAVKNWHPNVLDHHPWKHVDLGFQKTETPEAPVQTTIVTEPETKLEAQKPIEEEKPVEAVTQSSPDDLNVEVSASSPAVAFPRYKYLNPTLPDSGNRQVAKAYYNTGDAAQRSQEWKRAKAAYIEAAKADPAWFAARFELGQAAFYTGDTDLALQSFEHALSIEPNDGPARFNFAKSLVQGNYYADAARELETFLQFDPDNAQAHFEAGRLYAQELNDVARAAVHYKRVIGLKPGHPQAATIRYWLIRNKTDQSPDPDSSVAESISKDREAKPEPAPQSDLNVEVRPDGTVKIVPSENTEKTDVLIQEAEALIQSDKLDGALAKLREAQNFADQNQMPIIMANMGDVHYAKGEHKEAVDLYLKAAEQGYAYAQFSLGFMHQKGEGVAKDYSIAFHWTRKAANQGHVQAQYNLGVFHMNGWGTNANGAKASEWFQKAADNGHVKASQMPGVKKTTEETNISPTAGDNTEQE